VITTWHSSDGSETKRTRVCRHCGQHLTSREVFF
jgi:transcriptional regulator NrdR family protein